MSSRKRKKWYKDVNCVFFPNNIDCGVTGEKKPSALSSSFSARSWEKCGESFLDSTLIKDVKTPERKLSVSVHNSEDPVEIAWSSSSDSGQSDNNEIQQQWHHQLVVKKRRPTHSQSCPKALRTLCTDEDDMAVIETDGSEQDVEKDTGQQISDCDSLSCNEETEALRAEPTDLDISGYASDGETDCDILTTSRLDVESLQSGSSDGNKRSVSNWDRYAHAMLQTPKKTFDRQLKTPEDSAKKKRKFQSGSLAERLNRLNCRQRSAVSFWRYRSNSDNWTETKADRPGVLVLEVLEVQEECGAQLVRCQHHPRLGSANPHVLVLLCRETAVQLSPTPADIIHIHPPWQRLSVESSGYDIILNTHFSQKVNSAPPRGQFEAKRLVPYPLCQTFGTLEVCGVAEEMDNEQAAACDGSSKRSSAVLATQCHSLLEGIAGLGQTGSVAQHVVVVQRVYSIPAPSASIASIRLRSKTSSAAPPLEQGKRRLCVLVQDSFGMFSVVQLHLLYRDDLRRYCRAWLGRTCVLRGIKVVQRVTRERRSSLFSLIDSLWPPLKHPLECHGNAASMPTKRPPSFCYLLSGQESSVEPVEEGPSVSPLHHPSTWQTLRDALQNDHKTYCCSFIATVIYKRIQSCDVGQGEVWLVLTDQSLQGGSPDRPCRRTVPLHVNASCALTSCVVKALNDPAVCRLSFTDAIKEHGVLLCVEHSIIEVADSVDSRLTQEPPAQPARLDPLHVEVTPNSLCTLSGVIVGVDESASYSLPVCSQCGSHQLQPVPPPGWSFHCRSCNSTMDKPITKVQMEVFLSSASVQNCTIKVKLQHNTIMSLLDTAVLEHATACSDYDVSTVLGKEVGPLTLYVRVVSRRPSLWISLEEICL
ncbi:DNA repair-scaffolding protein isoform X1 [Hippocampus zosterae]|uniref:DNA repair-scaffolding protein isoform X1 n=1 Tax=Hippocampus zosterae TaxID=109293 RepID=UPI00223DB4BC|nr:DNA repair-scaffolding protein isoform X1 [Hippocampus zosterae]